MLRFVALSVLVVLAQGCRHRRAPPPRYDGVPGVPLQPTQTVYSTFGGDRELTPYGVPHDAILDEATIYVQPNAVCANVILRQPLGFDEPLSQLNMRCSADGRYKDRTFAQQEQPPTERDYPYQGAPPTLRVRGPHAWLDIPIGHAVPNMFRVIERSFQVCCPFTASQVFRLTIDGQARYQQYVRTDFAWRLQ